MKQYGHMTRKSCEGRALELLQALDATIHYRTGYYFEPLRGYVRAGRDPLTSTVLQACSENGLILVLALCVNGNYVTRVRITSDQDARRFCMKLRTQLVEKYPHDHAQVLYDLDLSCTKLTQWTREDYSSPRWSELVRLAMKLHYRAWFYDPKTGARYQ